MAGNTRLKGVLLEMCDHDIDNFISNKVDNGDLEGDSVESVMIPRKETLAWRSEFARYMAETHDNPDLDPKNCTNVEWIKGIMEFSHSGALAQAFVVEAVARYAKQVMLSKPEEFGNASIVSPEAWIEVGREINQKMEAKYGKRK